MDEPAKKQAQEKAREYLRARGTLVPAATIHARIADAFDALAKFVAHVPPERAAVRAWPAEWSVQEVVDHLVETHRPGLDELRCLLAGQRPPGDPIPAGLQSRAPLLRPWSWLCRELAAVHGDIVETLARVPPDFESAARAPLVMVVNVAGEDGGHRPLEWVEDLDWKAYAIVWRLHAIDHLNQARKTLAALG